MAENLNQGEKELSEIMERAEKLSIENDEVKSENQRLQAKLEKQRADHKKTIKDLTNCHEEFVLFVAQYFLPESPALSDYMERLNFNGKAAGDSRNLPNLPLQDLIKEVEDSKVKVRLRPSVYALFKIENLFS